MMLTIPKITLPVGNLAERAGYLRSRALHLAIAACAWPDFRGRSVGAMRYPDARVSLAHDGANLHVLFDVVDHDLGARFLDDRTQVWRESCVEAFISFPDAPGNPAIYYNLEFNALATALIQAGTGRDEGREFMPPEICALIKREGSLGRNPVAHSDVLRHWQLLVSIPVAAFWQHQITSFDGLTVRANFYKCADDLPSKHYLSWRPVATPAPDFHRPEFFGALQCAAVEEL